jgi:hypothetical protein
MPARGDGDRPLHRRHHQRSLHDRPDEVLGDELAGGIEIAGAMS